MPTVTERARAWTRAVSLEAKLLYARRARQKSLYGLGRIVSASDPANRFAENEPLVVQVRSQQEQLSRLRAELEASLVQDRTDYARAQGIVRGAVILRGLLARWVIRHQLRALEREGRHEVEALAETALNGRIAWEAASPPDQALLERARLQEVSFEELVAAHQESLDAVGERLFPRWIQIAAAEVTGLVKAIAREATGRWIPRSSALVGLLAGWWVAQSFTTSGWSGFLSTFGLYHGKARIVSRAQYDQLQFWIPVVAAALCSYAAARLTQAVRERYEPAPMPISSRQGRGSSR